jgi:hypothetical protein
MKAPKTEVAKARKNAAESEHRVAFVTIDLLLVSSHRDIPGGAFPRLCRHGLVVQDGG